MFPYIESNKDPNDWRWSQAMYNPLIPITPKHIIAIIEKYGSITASE
jgi:hypothetical protein